MKVYLVMKYSNYDFSDETIIKVFLSEENAKQYVDDENCKELHSHQEDQKLTYGHIDEEDEVEYVWDYEEMNVEDADFNKK